MSFFEVYDDIGNYSATQLQGLINGPDVQPCILEFTEDFSPTYSSALQILGVANSSGETFGGFTVDIPPIDAKRRRAMFRKGARLSRLCYSIEYDLDTNDVNLGYEYVSSSENGGNRLEAQYLTIPYDGGKRRLTSKAAAVAISLPDSQQWINPNVYVSVRPTNAEGWKSDVEELAALCNQKPAVPSLPGRRSWKDKFLLRRSS